jgi:light-regulated signal transduction histidine kinase (bacteriophytochrome)
MTELALDELTRLTEDCVHEPIQAPGAVQPHGTLLAAGLHDGTIVNVGAQRRIVPRRRARDDARSPPGRGAGPEAADDILAAARGPGGTNSVMGVRAAAGVRLDALVHGRDEVAIVELQHAADPGTAGAHLHRVRAAIAQLDAATSPTGLFAAAVEAFRELTGYDRVMVYRFDADGHGQVVAESRRDDLEAFLGLHYPASDIPAQARALMLEQPLRVIVDVDYEPQAVTPVGNPYTGRPLDLGRALLRSVAPVHLQYLRNMGSAATLTVALVRDGRLWGMVAAHHMTPYPVSIALGEGCRLFADVLAHRIGAAEELERGVHRVRLARVGQRLIDAAARRHDARPGAGRARPRAARADGRRRGRDPARVRDGSGRSGALGRGRRRGLPSAPRRRRAVRQRGARSRHGHRRRPERGQRCPRPARPRRGRRPHRLVPRRAGPDRRVGRGSAQAR